jgi:hypothetical protein
VIGDRGIVTLCDANYFPGRLMLYKSVQQSEACPLVCFDAGLTDEQRVCAGKLRDLQIRPLPADPLIAVVRSNMHSAPAPVKANKRVWPLWICPILIKHAPFRDVVWLDCDLVVLRGLAGLFTALEAGPLFTPENKAPQATPNHPDLYRFLPIERSFDPLVPVVNAGVSAWRKDRDAAAIEAYILPVAHAAHDEKVRRAISWQDQGALIWAIQYCGLEHRVAETTTWNLCVDHTPIVNSPAAWDENFLENARAKVPDANIIHWNGRPPPWTA